MPTVVVMTAVVASMMPVPTVVVVPAIFVATDVRRGVLHDVRTHRGCRGHDVHGLDVHGCDLNSPGDDRP